MAEAWSINRLAAELRVDRRTVTKYVALGDVKPAGAGAKGPTYRLRDAVCVLADAGLFESRPARAEDSRHQGGSEAGARELAERVVHALAKRLDRDALRVVLEVMTAELHSHIGRVYGRASDGGEFHGEALDWPALSDADLETALRDLIDDGHLRAEGSA